MNRQQCSKRKDRKRGRADSDASWDVVHPHAAGIDLGAREHFVAVPPERGRPQVKRFGCYTADLGRMAQWLRSRSVETVAMESTGVYWVPVYEFLEREGFAVLLVDTSQTRNVSGRKSDVQDCQWIQRLHTFGLLRGAYRPSEAIATLRGYWRHRESLVQSSSRQIHLMQKALEQMNVQLHKAVSDITGVTGTRIIEAILAGERDPVALARLRHAGVKRSEAELAKALEGTWHPAHLFALEQAYQSLQFHQRQIQTCDQTIEQYMHTLGPAPAAPASPALRAPNRRRKNQPHFDLRREQHRILGADLTKIPGIDTLTAQSFLTECGDNVDAFPTEKHFASWLALSPNNRVTGGRIRTTSSRKNANRLATALRVAAQSLHKSQTALGAYYRRMRTRLGAPKAITATARKLACILYRLVKYGEDYVEHGVDYYEKQHQKRVIENLRRRAQSMGLQLLDDATGEILS